MAKSRVRTSITRAEADAYVGKGFGLGFMAFFKINAAMATTKHPWRFAAALVTGTTAACTAVGAAIGYVAGDTAAGAINGAWIGGIASGMGVLYTGLDRLSNFDGRLAEIKARNKLPKHQAG